MDYFSKWPEAAPLPDKMAIGVASFLYELFCRYNDKCSLQSLPITSVIIIIVLTILLNRFGCCEILISDQRRGFVNQVKEKLFEMTGTEHRVTSAYHPQSNGLTERFNQTLQTALVKITIIS